MHRRRQKQKQSGKEPIWEKILSKEKSEDRRFKKRRYSGGGPVKNLIKKGTRRPKKRYDKHTRSKKKRGQKKMM